MGKKAVSSVLCQTSRKKKEESRRSNCKYAKQTKTEKAKIQKADKMPEKETSTTALDQSKLVITKQKKTKKEEEKAEKKEKGAKNKKISAEEAVTIALDKENQYRIKIEKAIQAKLVAE